LSEKLKEHQIEGLRFIWDNLVQTLEDFSVDNVGTGAILAHSMGLGKTLQAVAFIHTLLKNNVLREARLNTQGLHPIKSALVIAPVNTLSNWFSELNKWLPFNEKFNKVINLETSGAAAGPDRLRVTPCANLLFSAFVRIS
jgi:transcriptional regulator ATRX